MPSSAIDSTNACLSMNFTQNNKHHHINALHLQYEDLWTDVSLKQTVTELVDAGGGCAGHCRVDDRLQSGWMNDWMMKTNDVLVACQLQTTETTTKTANHLKVF